jgi:molybdopterin synthase sulfur carrier subunit
VKLLYFARFRQIIGKSGETLELPPEVITVSSLIDYLSDRDAGCAAAFADRKIIRAAINQNHVSLDASLEGAVEVALFPPVTGG